MKAYRISLATAAILLAFSVSACAGASSGSGTKETSDRSRSEHLSTVSAKDFDSADFDVSRRVLTTVTDLTKVIDGVNAMVVWERDYTEGEEVEAELPSSPRTSTAASGTFGRTPRRTRMARW
jgi:hypothetical protein